MMPTSIRIGLLHEGKIPPDQRVPLTPGQCRELMDRFPHVEVVAQNSPTRAFSNREYLDLGIPVEDDLASCDILLGVKEVPVGALIPDKTYLFFSHTMKRQVYNRELLRTILDKRIRLIDYEALKSPEGARLIGFGQYAGIVGAYSGLRGYGLASGRYELRAAHECRDRLEMEGQYSKVELPSDFRIVITGHGRVGQGAVDVLSAIGIRKVPVKDFLDQEFDEPVYVQLGSLDYNTRKDGKLPSRNDFFENPQDYESNFMRFAQKADMFIACHYWAEGSPYIFTRGDAHDPEFRIRFVSDISCDIDGPVASTLRPSTIAEPYYGYDRITEQEVPFGTPGSISVQAVDNLPCELPRDSSEDFGRQLMANVLPLLVDKDPHGIIAQATETTDGKLTPQFAYLHAWVEGD